ncbi:MAG: TetR/AcrR family transcriptional regulator [Pseudomonadota bacterium]
MTAHEHVKATRETWMDAARHALITAGEEQVKVALLGAQLGVSRSSFYWYFRDRQDLLDALLEEWEATNTAALVAQAQAPAANITAAICNVFKCFVSQDTFHTPLDFAIRDWARRDESVRAALDASDARRLDALQEMFARYGYAPTDALVRARVLYYMQIGYNAAELNEPMERRITLNPYYVACFSGQDPTAPDLAAFAAFARQQVGERHDEQS